MGYETQAMNADGNSARPRAAVADVLRLIDESVRPLGAERIPCANAADRILVERVLSPVDVPGFAKAAMDGFAVRSGSARLLRVAGNSLPNRSYNGDLPSNSAIRITTGAPIPTGTDCVIPLELADETDGGVRLHVEAVAGKHVIRIGEDVTKGAEVLSSGRELRPQDLGLLAAIGVREVNVVRRPRVAIIVTGNELLPPGSMPTGTQIVDSNSPMLAALIARDGDELISTRYVFDELPALRDAIRNADADVLLISGGSSVGPEDYGAAVVAELGKLAVHGIAMKPGAPAGIGFLRDPDCIAFLLPGNPVSCLFAYDLFAGRAIRILGGRNPDMPYGRITARLASGIASVAGRLDYVRIKLKDGIANPIAAGASRLSSTVEADGFILVPHERDSLAAGEEVEVRLYDSH